eukprot:TRINITY_DN54534_c0_g1_i1.p1 TRINITY_DN54534_c0_g1~~TRINITY_DN54534_c0_g1_i1.p1  ORF type:complete len:503 (+),score=45.75 TRINITY_DN54534_c0_g1_i1:19-1527(+)
MDAKYLVTNVNTALSEALSAMVAVQPNDSIEFIGKYLLQYVERQEHLEAEKVRELEVEGLAIDEMEKEKQNAAIAEEKKALVESYNAKLDMFIENLGTSLSKQAAMETATNFITEYLNVPASYVGIVKKNGETECLHYFGANKGQEHILGKKLMKPAEEGEEAPLRQGLSFDAFKIPEVPEEETPPLEEGEEPPPPKPAPTVQPIIIDDVMRDTRIKYFGIPKIGSYVCIQLKYNTIDHDASVVVGSDDYTQSPLPQNVLFCMDTMGKYREFTPKDVEIGKKVGETLVAAFETIEGSMFKKHTAFLGTYKSANNDVQAAAAKIGETETTALANVGASLPAEISDSEKAVKEGEASVKTWGDEISGNSMLVDSILSLQNHLLPSTQVVATLFYCVAIMGGANPKECKDVCGDITWEAIRALVLKNIPELIKNFDCNAVRTVNNENSLDAIKKITEENNLFDTSIYPPTIAVCNPLAMWLQKAVNARTAAIAFQAENNVNLETK